MLDKFLLGPNRLAIVGALLLASLVLGAGGGLWAASSFYSGRLTDCNTRLGATSNANANLTAGITHQNAGVQALKQAGEEDSKRLDSAVAVAKDKAKPHERKATEILLKVPAPGADLCKTAQEEFDAELKLERGKL